MAAAKRAGEARGTVAGGGGGGGTQAECNPVPDSLGLRPGVRQASRRLLSRFASKENA